MCVFVNMMKHFDSLIPSLYLVTYSTPMRSHRKGHRDQRNTLVHKDIQGKNSASTSMSLCQNPAKTYLHFPTPHHHPRLHPYALILHIGLPLSWSRGVRQEVKLLHVNFPTFLVFLIQRIGNFYFCPGKCTCNLRSSVKAPTYERP